MENGVSDGDEAVAVEADDGPEQEPMKKKLTLEGNRTQILECETCRAKAKPFIAAKQRVEADIREVELLDKQVKVTVADLDKTQVELANLHLQESKSSALLEELLRASSAAL